MKKRFIVILLMFFAVFLTAKEYKIFGKYDLRERKDISIELPDVPEGYKPILCFTARLHNYGVTGWTQAVFVQANGRIVTGAYLLNKPVRPKTASGHLEVYIARHGFLLPYSYDFTSANLPGSPLQKMLKPIEPYDFYNFELDLSDFVKKGKNTIAWIPRSPLGKTYIIFDKAYITFKPISAYKKFLAPVGELPVMVPEEPLKNAIEIKSSKIPLVINHQGKQWNIASKFSTPDGKWVTGSNAYFTHKREVKKLAEMVMVSDTFTNMTADNLPIMQRHEIVIPDGKRKFVLAGVEKNIGNVENKFNCTSYGSANGSGVGMYPMNTEFQAHACNYIDKNILGLADNQMVLPPRGQITQQFVVVPTKRADYWQFVNAVRRQIGANFTLERADMGFAPVWGDKEWPDEKLRQLAELKGVNSFSLDTWGVMGHGEFDRKSPKLEIMRQAMLRFRRLFPGKKIGIYYHSQLIAAKDFKPYYEDRIIGKDGKPVTYYGSKDPIFFTTLTNTTGRLFEARLKMFMDMGIDAIFWDETGFSRVPYHYGKPWDGISGDIDPKTHKISKLKSSILLLQEPWKLKMMKMMRDRNISFTGNCGLSGGMLKMKFSTMAETDVLSNCTEMALWSPLQFGDYTSGKETMESMCRAMHSGLDYGCLYIWPSARLPRTPISQQYKCLATYMYPATPIELREGMVFARERILTNRSGLFGWNDNSKHEVRVFNEKGREQENFKAPFIERNGKTYTEIRIPAGWAAVIIRKGK